MIYVAVSFCSILLILIDFNKSVCSAVNNNQNNNYFVKNGRRHQIVTTKTFLAANAKPKFSTTHNRGRKINVSDRTTFINLNHKYRSNLRRCNRCNDNTFTIGSATKTILRVENDLRQQFYASNVRYANRKLKNQYNDDDSVENRNTNEARIQRERNQYQQDLQEERRQRIPKNVVEEYENDWQDIEEDEGTYYKSKSRATSSTTMESQSTINESTINDSSSQGNLRRRQRQKSTRMIENDENDDNDTGFANYYNNVSKNRGTIDSEYLDDNLEEDYYYDEEYPDDYDSNTKRPEMVWEQCATPDNAGTASVLLPPSDVDRPSCIIHFIGGTLFGSAPTIWYKNLLEYIVQNTNAVVIATSIPITVFSSPLQHIELAKRCYKQFKTAYRTIVLDEYCYGGLITEEQFALDVPICGIGHSLGARLLTVLTTLKPEPVPDSAVRAMGSTTAVTPLDQEISPASREVNRKKRQRKLQQQQLSYKAFILISFTNYGAASGIPGIYQLTKQSEKLQYEQALADSITIGQEKQRQRELKLRARRRLQNKERRQPYDSFDSSDLDDDFDDDLNSTTSPLVTDLLDRIRTSTLGIKTLLTPEPDALEFYPTPSQLWKAILDDKRYRVPKTLLVQFDNDQIDQSAKLATTLLLLKDGVNQVEKDDKHLDINADRPDGDNFPWLDVRFARLRGDHLTPVSIGGNDASITSEKGSTTRSSSSLPPQVAAVNQVFRAALLLSSSSTSKGNFNSKKLRNERRSQFDELRQSIIRYINDVATKVDD